MPNYVYWLIAVALLLALAALARAHRYKSIPQFDPEAPTIEPTSPTPSEQAAELTAIVEAGPSAFTLRPNWDEAPEWAMWAVQEQAGWLYWSEDMPFIKRDHWHSGWSGRRRAVIADAPANPNWKQAIEQRPVKREAYESLPVPTPEEVQRVAENTWRLVEVPAPERHNYELVSRDELERLLNIEAAGKRYVRNYSSEKNFERLAKSLGVGL